MSRSAWRSPPPSRWPAGGEVSGRGAGATRQRATHLAAVPDRPLDPRLCPPVHLVAAGRTAAGALARGRHGDRRRARAELAAVAAVPPADDARGGAALPV